VSCATSFAAVPVCTVTAVAWPHGHLDRRHHRRVHRPRSSTRTANAGNSPGGGEFFRARPGAHSGDDTCVAMPAMSRAAIEARSRESVVGVHVGGRLAHISIQVHRAELPLRRRIGSSVAGEWIAKRCVSRAATLKKTSWTLWAGLCATTICDQKGWGQGGGGCVSLCGVCCRGRRTGPDGVAQHRIGHVGECLETLCSTGGFLRVGSGNSGAADRSDGLSAFHRQLPSAPGGDIGHQ
jgi:hypothetical protein